MALLTTLCNMSEENRKHYLMDNDDLCKFTIAELEEVIEYLGRDPHEFRCNSERMYMYIKEACGCYTEEGNRWR